MTGGENGFYQKIGYQNAVKRTFWQSDKVKDMFRPGREF